MKKQSSQTTSDNISAGKIKAAEQRGIEIGKSMRDKSDKLATRVGVATIAVAGTVAVGAGIAWAASRGIFRGIRGGM